MKSQGAYKFIKNLLLTLSLISFSVYGQKYKDMMDDTSYNVYDVINAGNSYFEGKDKGKGSGWKQFQRWIIANEDLFYPSGDRSNYQPETPYLLAISKQKQAYSKTTSSSKLLAGGSWAEVGPFVELKRYYDNVRNGNGRVDAIWVDPSNANRIYIGCRGGGMWTTTDGGTNWSVKTDELGITGVNSIAVNPSNVNEIYIATALAGGRSLGVFKSTDAGNTWNATGVSYQLTGNITINRIVMSPTSSSVLFAATSSGLLKSTDGFQTYTTVLSGNILDVEFKPGVTTVMYASNKSNYTIYKSTNGGDSFTSTGLVCIANPKIAVSANQPNYVYVSDEGVLYRSIDSGLNFTFRGNPDEGIGQYGGFAVSDTNANLVMNGSLDTYRSTDGGSNFTKVTDWIYNNSTGVGGNFVHADIREIEVVNGTIYLGTDGWLCRSTDGGNNYDILTFNVGNHEVYEHGMGVSQSNENTLVIGTQDNGTSILRNGVWYHWKGGDGGTSMIDDTTSDIIYGSLYNGDFKRTDNGGTTGTSVDLGDTKPGTLPPLVKHPTDAATIFLGEANGQVWKSTNRGGTWTTIGNLGGTSVVDEMNVAPSNGDYIYVSINNRIWRTINGGASWTELTGILPNLVIKGIAIDYDDPNKVVVCYTSYTSGTKIYQTTNGGTSWTNISGTLPNLPMTDVVYDNNTNNTLYVSTETGVYYRDDTLSDWTEYGTGLPNVRANDLEIQHSSSMLYVGTWGRGVWKILLDGVVPTAPTSNFKADATNIIEGSIVNFTDLSTSLPTSWSWSFPGGVPATSTAQNPSVTYETAGTYNVTLTATNAQGSDVETKVDYIKVNVSGTGLLQGQYNFQNNLDDSSPYLRNLSVVGGFTPIYVNDKDANSSSAYQVPGTSGNYLANDYKGIGADGERTVTAWVKTTTAGTRKTIASWGANSPGQMFNVMIENGNIRVEGGACNVQNDDSSVARLDGDTWRHIAVTYDPTDGDKASDVKLYIDGVFYANQPDSGDSFNSETTVINTDNIINNLQVGNANYNANYYWRGELDDVRIYSKALTPSEISTVMVGGSLGTNEINLKDKIKVYPNPFLNTLMVMNNTGSELNIKVYDSLGKLIETDMFKTENNITINMASNSSGLYFVVINAKDGTSRFKVIKR